MHTFRTRFKKDIVAEFFPSTAVLRGKREKKTKVMIFASGMPGVPSIRPTLDFFSKKGYWVFAPRYRGTWESGGKFLKISPHQDLLDIIHELPRGFKSLYDGKRYKINPEQIYIFCSSFGGPAGILASENKRITKVVAFSPVCDWRAESKTEPFHKLEKFVREAFGEAYRPAKNAYKKLKSGTFYNPATALNKIDGKKIFIIHAADDDVVNAKSVKKFAKDSGAKILLLKRGGHLSLRYTNHPRFWKKINQFIKEAPR